MDTSTMLAILTFGTLLAGVIFAMVGKVKTEERLHDPNAPKSTLAKDGPQGGVDFNSES